MCGITGWIDWKNNLRNEEKTIRNMAKTLSLRGPDAINVWNSNHVAFGHTRLIVVDPEGGHQPMKREKDGQSYTLIYNGELYNTEEIRQELLKRGYSFKGHSDTEVLLTAYIEWNEECLQYLNGIFAFAIWNEQTENVFIARDRLGVKPLFYKENNGRLLFGSELKAILEHPEVKAEIDYDGLADVFGLGPSRTPGHGIFKGFKELRPAHAMTFSRAGLKVWRYWNVKSKEHNENAEETAETIRHLFQDAVKRQLISDVPIGTFLSGGLDSSAITAIAANTFKEENKKLHTFSIDFEGNDKYFKPDEFQPNSDEDWVKVVSDTFGTEHQSFIINSDELVEQLKDAVRVRDFPGQADVDSSLLWFCKKIKNEVTVGLSGECADEIFGGYPWFHRKEDLERQAFPWMRSTEVREQLLRKDWKGKLNIRDYVQYRYQETIAETPKLDGESKLEASRRELFYLNMQWFMAQLLERKDRMSMGASLEVRVPFADHHLVEYVWNVPWNIKMYGNQEKGILRKAMEGILPDDVLYRKKSPYPKTHNPNYETLVYKWMKEIVDNPSSPIFEVFDRKELRHLLETGGNSIKSPWYGQLMKGPQLLAHIAQIDYWLKEYNVNIIDS